MEVWVWLFQSEVKFKPSRKAPSKSTTTREATLKIKGKLLASTTKRVETAAAAAAHSHLVKVLPPVISYAFVFIAKNLKQIATISHWTNY